MLLTIAKPQEKQEIRKSNRENDAGSRAEETDEEILLQQINTSVETTCTQR